MHLPSAERPCVAWIASCEQAWGTSSRPTFARSCRGAWALALLSAALHIHLRQKVCCRILLSDVTSFKLWSPCCRRWLMHHKQPLHDPSQPCTWQPALLRQQCDLSAAQRWGHQPLQAEPGMCHAAGRTGVSWQDQAATFGNRLSFLQQGAHGQRIQHLQCSSLLSFSGLSCPRRACVSALGCTPCHHWMNDLEGRAFSFKLHVSGCAGDLCPSGPASVPESSRRQPQPAQPG